MTTLELQRDVPLAPLTTLELGGHAKYFVRVEDETTLVDAVRWAADEGVPSAILGGGSNLIVPDEGYDGLVIHMGIANLEFGIGGTVDAGAGVPWETVLDGAVSRDWAGLECLTGIPGSTGATPIQNVGAYGQEIAEVVAGVRVLRRDTHSLRGASPPRLAASVIGTASSSMSPVASSSAGFALPCARTARQPSATQSLGATSVPMPRWRTSGAPFSTSGAESPWSSIPTTPNRRSAGSFFLNPIVSDAEAQRVVEQAVHDKLVSAPADVPRYPAQNGEVKLAAGWLIEKGGDREGHPPRRDWGIDEPCAGARAPWGRHDGGPAGVRRRDPRARARPFRDRL